ncbi:universal stress protein [Caenimonas koreensis]|uniref:Universal stress protein n=1 Tax=Caenimonas koreensis DSM 17982 TaxID=1121255 RepID=A0A844BBK7_9BURK|nr:universal stress protein [Caenimonas koreensis]MRD47891.1 universal stress protein [Caenimonas koreensis DSM 17982]
MYTRILVTTDGSTLSKKAVRSAIELASATGAELIALHVVPRYPVSYFEGSISMNPEELASTEKRWAEKGQAIVDAVVTQARSAGVTAKGVITKSDLVAESIVGAAKKYKCDLVMMASHGRKGIKRLLLGSETQHVLTHCTIPVLVLR